MRRVLAIAAISAAILFSNSCWRKAANTDETANANAAAVDVPVFTDANAALAEGTRLLDENQTEAAIAVLKQAVELNPDLAEAHFKLGVAYSLLEMQMMRTGGSLPTEPDAEGKKSSKPMSERSFEKAVKAYEKWLKENPDDDNGHYNLGRTYSKLLKDEEAEKEFRQAVKLKPDDTEYQTELGAVLIKLAQYREAVAPLKKAIELDSTNDRAIALLEDAEAGRQRVDYVSKNTNANSNANVNANANSNSNSSSSPNSSTNSASPAANLKPTPAVKPSVTPAVPQKEIPRSRIANP